MRRQWVAPYFACSVLVAGGCDVLFPYTTAADSRRPDVVGWPDVRRGDVRAWDARRDGPRPPDTARADGELKLDAAPHDAPKVDATKPDGPGCVQPKAVDSCDQATGWCTILAGCFQMGSPPAELCRDANDETQHQVTLTHSFVISRTHVTQSAFLARMSYNPSSNFGCTDCPVEQVTWHEAAAYCNALSVFHSLGPCYGCNGSGTGVSCAVLAAYQGSAIYTCPGYRLPTDAEYEYVTRAGTTTALYNGALGECGGKADANAQAIAWYKYNGGPKPHPVGLRDKNGWGLRDMSGNIWEWVHDGYVADLGSVPDVDPARPFTGTLGVLRGGSYFDDARHLRSAARYEGLVALKVGTNGLRCVRTLP